GLAGEIRPFRCTLVPEKRRSPAAEGGLDAAGQREALGRAVETLHQGGLLASLFIEPEDRQVQAAKELGADFVEINTGHYAEAPDEEEAMALFTRLVTAVKSASATGLRVILGHGLDYVNIWRFKGLEEVEEYSLGHAVIARAVLVGLDRAVRDMVEIVRRL
ncbi:MAG: pyridoxine 5'-phosphate synthase, partial [Thermodesulfobacteriota bacterium]